MLLVAAAAAAAAVVAVAVAAAAAAAQGDLIDRRTMAISNANDRKKEYKPR